MFAVLLVVVVERLLILPLALGSLTVKTYSCHMPSQACISAVEMGGGASTDRLLLMLNREALTVLEFKDLFRSVYVRISGLRSVAAQCHI